MFVKRESTRKKIITYLTPLCVPVYIANKTGVNFAFSLTIDL